MERARSSLAGSTTIFKKELDDECGSAFDRVYTCVGVGEASIYRATSKSPTVS